MFTFVNFKNFADAKLDLSRPLTLLIGKNGSGKSNAIEGVELLAELAGGRPLHEISDTGRGGGFELRGGLVACARSGQHHQFALGWSDPRKSLGAYHLKIKTEPEPRIVGEELVANERKIFWTSDDNAYAKKLSRILEVHYDNFARGGNKPIAQIPSDRSALSQYGSFAASVLAKKDPRSLFPLTIRQQLKNLQTFDPEPKLMRIYERIGNRTLMRNGSNLSAVLYALKNGEASEHMTLTRILSSIKQLPEEPYESFDFVTTSLNDVIFGLKQTAAGPLMDARLLSDGTLRCLAVLTALETVEEGSRVVIEEFDNGLHPSRVGLLTQAIWEASKRRKLSVLVTTHNPATLDSLTGEQLQGVVLCFWDKEKKGSQLVPLLELPRADVLLERGQLGDLVTQRVLEQHLAPGFTTEQQRKAEAWLERLK